MTISQTDIAELVHDDGTVCIIRLSQYLSELPHFFELSRQVSLYITHKMCQGDEFEGGWSSDAATRVIAFSAWLRDYAEVTSQFQNAA